MTEIINLAVLELAFERKKVEIASLETVEETIEYHAKAQALLNYFKSQHKDRKDIQNKLAELKIDAACQGGELLKQMADRGKRMAKGGEYQTFQTESSEKKPTLADLKISEAKSHRWQMIAKLPKKEREKYYDKEKKRAEGDGELTESGLYRYADRHFRKPPEFPPMPKGRYRVIYADPPWQYSDELVEEYGTAEHHYGTLSIKELCEMPFPKTTKDTVLFLWITVPIKREEKYKEVLNSWGFIEHSEWIWNKRRHNFGHWNSVRHEYLLICTKGDCPLEVQRLFPSVVSIDRTKIHSKKPEYFRKMIDVLYPSGRRVELFARSGEELKKKYPHWDPWGEET
jgi:N6-adenosine-specific RNA methylase IME4